MQQGKELIQKELDQNKTLGKLVRLDIGDLIKAHPLVKGVLSGFKKYVDEAEPSKKDRPKLILIVTDNVSSPSVNLMTGDKSKPSENARLITIELHAEKNKMRKVLIKQPTKVNNMLGIFHEGDGEGERDLSLFVEGVIVNVIAQLAIIGSITAVNQSFYNE